MPPLPTPINLPFQLEAGIQTSNLISESAEGLVTAATRQKGGRSLAATMVMPPRKPGDGKGDGGVNAPAETIWTTVIVVFGSLSAIRLSQAVAAVSCGQAEIAKRNADAVLVIVRICIKAPYSRSAFHQPGKASAGQAGIPSMITKSADVGYT